MNSRTTLRDKLMNIIEKPMGRKEAELVHALKLLHPQVLEFILGTVDLVTAREISDYGCANFERLDFRPNPSDRLVSDHEILEALENSTNSQEQVILVAIYLRFDEIRVCSDDFEGAEAVFDNQLSYNDFYKFGLV